MEQHIGNPLAYGVGALVVGHRPVLVREQSAAHADRVDVSGDLQPVQHLGLDPAAHLGDRLGGIHRPPPQSVYRSVEYRIPDVGCLEHQQMACLGGFPVRGGPNALRQSKIQNDRGGQGLRASILVQ
ncbi:Uncharacterised protein [Mycobacteroides abscessus subsp. abscessus]|nr:Uncharacterised protein [Mycobacteroides abscessus subsp. abscessus]